VQVSSAGQGRAKGRTLEAQGLLLVLAIQHDVVPSSRSLAHALVLKVPKVKGEEAIVGESLVARDERGGRRVVPNVPGSRGRVDSGNKIPLRLDSVGGPAAPGEAPALGAEAEVRRGDHVARSCPSGPIRNGDEQQRNCADSARHAHV